MVAPCVGRGFTPRQAGREGPPYSLLKEPSQPPSHFIPDAASSSSGRIDGDPRSFERARDAGGKQDAVSLACEPGKIGSGLLRQRFGQTQFRTTGERFRGERERALPVD